MISGKNSLNFRREIERRSVLLWECLYHYTFTKYPQNPKLKSGKVWRIMSVWFESYDITKKPRGEGKGQNCYFLSNSKTASWINSYTGSSWQNFCFFSKGAGNLLLSTFFLFSWYVDHEHDCFEILDCAWGIDVELVEFP